MSATSDVLTVHAPAKLNLSLEVLGKRPDGYHELVSVMQTVSLYDTLNFQPHACIQTTTLGEVNLPNDLVDRALTLAQEWWHIPGVRSTLQKIIPVAAGLGGGSSDAAAALLATRHLFALSTPCTEFIEAAAALGSDVPFFLFAGTALVEGRGERITPIRHPDSAWYLLVNPGFPISTADVFSALEPEDWSSGHVTHSLASAVIIGEEPRLGVNSLQPVATRLYPDLARCIRRLEDVSGAPALLSGSGPTVFTVVSGPDVGNQGRSRMERYGYWSRVVTAVPSPALPSPCRS